jgi:hypothetical protein
MTCRMPGRRVKGGFARYAALDPPVRRGGREGGVRRAEEDGGPKGEPRSSPTRLKGARP